MPYLEIMIPDRFDSDGYDDLGVILVDPKLGLVCSWMNQRSFAYWIPGQEIDISFLANPIGQGLGNYEESQDLYTEFEVEIVH